MITTGTITDIGLDINSRKAKISLVLDTNELDIVEQLKNENKLNIEMKKYRQKRSLDANSYCWVLCDKIAKSMQGGISKEDVYKDAISYVGTFEPMIIDLCLEFSVTISASIFIVSPLSSKLRISIAIPCGISSCKNKSAFSRIIS